jgi:hypothetical protein
MTKTFHESYSRDEAVIVSSDRSFGIVMAAAFGLISLLNWWHGGRSWPWTSGIAALCLAAALFYPTILRPFNRLWLKFGLLLHKVVNPIVTALVFFGTVLPTGLIMRALGKDSAAPQTAAQRHSYSIERRPPGPTPESMKDQF